MMNHPKKVAVLVILGEKDLRNSYSETSCGKGLSSLNMKILPQHCSYGSAGVPAVPATISISEI